MEDLIRRARKNDQTALDELFCKIRPELKAIAERSLDQRLASRFDASDVVQQTMADAFKAIGQLVNVTDQGFLAWMRTMLQHDVEDLVRKHIVAKTRSIYSQVSLDASSPEGNAVGDILVASCSTPSRAAVRNERSVALYEALKKIPADQAEAVRMRHLEEMPLDEISRRMNRSPGAVSQLLMRGMKALQPILKDKI